MELNEQQKKAVSLLQNGKMGVVTGGPGTGKTTILSTLASATDSTSVFAAPTGKAAKRISEVTGATASTIHRMLGKRLYSTAEDGPLPYSRIIVDEASMVDVTLAAALLRAVGAGTSVFFVGDADQLPSVAPGYFFGDLIASGAVPVVRLEEVHRAAAGSWVCRNAPMILEGGIDLEDTDDFEFMERGTSDGARDAVVDTVVAALRAGESVQVLAPQKSGSIGVVSMNNRIQSRYFTSRRRTWDVGDQRIGEGDHVIHTKNDYDLEVFNGETGVVTDVTAKNLIVDYGDRDVMYNVVDSDNLMLSYALTIHKAQGSEWDKVIVLCSSEHHYMWTRQLLYTAVTRSKQHVTLVGDGAGVEAALGQRGNMRSTMLKTYIEDAMAEEA